MQSNKFDVIVIGSGPGGEGASIKAAKEGKTVGMIEKGLRVGGNCTHLGTIPSKSLRQAVQQLVDFKNNPFFEDIPIKVNFEDLLRTASSVIGKQVKMRQNFYERNFIQLIHGTAKFTGPNSIEVIDEDGRVTGMYDAKHFVISTGSRPYRPDDIDFTHPRIFDSDTILSLKGNPQSITVYGAGVIGSEYGSIFRNLGIKVNLVNTRDKLLSFLDDEIIDALAYHLREQGTIIRHNETYSKIEADDDGVTVHLNSGKQLKTDIFLFA
ncbi:MAG: FAD-dependent oxidoreductase, partial [Leptospiraceae bacterium]|nr:FAD-dependent oxidoreductase [Leptospiraceae bacterium]